ncbi:MAG: XrtA system polysaccharide chain length determinant [Geminicoccaceae bacterium]
MVDYRALLLPHLAALKRHRWQALAVAWLVCLLGWLFLASMPDRYMSRARLYVDTETILGPLMKGLAVAPDFDRQVEMMRRTLLSVPNLEELVRMTDLDHTVHSDLDRLTLVEDLAKDIHIKTEGVSLFEISYTHQNARLTQRVVDSILQIFVEQNLGHSQKDVEEARDFIDKQIEDYEAKLRQAEIDVAKFKKEHADEIGGVERNQRSLESREVELRRLNAEIDSAIWRRDQLKSQIANTPKTLAVSYDILPSGQNATQLRIQALAQELQSKLTVYTERHPEVIALRSMIENAQQQMAIDQVKNGSAGTRIANPDYAALVEQVQLSEASIQDLQRRLALAEGEVSVLSTTVASAPEVEADLTRLTRDYNVLLAQYEQLIQRRESAQIARDLDSGISRIEYRIIDPPVVPLQPVGPPRGLFLAAILLVGFASGVAFAIGRQLMSGSFLTVDQLKAAIDLPILGGVSEAIRPAQDGRLMAGWGGVAGGSLALVGVFVALLYLSDVVPPVSLQGAIATSPEGSPLQWIWARL